jgi:hypothetical protein
MQQFSLLSASRPELLRRSQEQKAQRDKERLEAYYKKNFKARGQPQS